MEPRICPDCGNEEDQIVLDDGDSFYHCWHCERQWAAEREFYAGEINEPEDDYSYDLGSDRFLRFEDYDDDTPDDGAGEIGNT